VFVPVTPLQPSLMFAGEAWALYHKTYYSRNLQFM
jgi:hypothetical protein